MKVIAIVGYHNSGKTTLIEHVVDELTAMGLKVGYVKHDPKGHGETDREGSDTFRLRGKTCKRALLSPGEVTLWEREWSDLMKFLHERFSDCDVVILEGFKGERWVPKVVVGELEVEGVLFRVESSEEFKGVVEFIKGMEDNL